MVKTFKNILLWNPKVNDLERWYAASVLQNFQICSNDDPELTLTYFTARSNLIPYAFVWEKGKTRTVRGSDYSPAVVLSEEKNIS